MPDRQEVRRACYKVMSKFGYEGIQRRRVREQMHADGLSPGSNRDLTPLISEFRKEVSDIVTTLPIAIQDKATELAQDAAAPLARNKLIEFANEIWHFARASRIAVPNFAGGGAEPERRAPRSPAQPKRRSVRLGNLQNVVERMLAADAQSLIPEPISAAEIYRRLGKTHQTLTDANHIARDLKRIDSKVLYVTPEGKKGKWWRRDRPLPHGDGKTLKRAPRTNSPQSLKRQQNEPVFEKVISVLISAKGPVKGEEIARALQIPEDDIKAFCQMLRNRLRGKKRRIDRNDEGNYFVINRAD